MEKLIPGTSPDMNTLPVVYEEEQITAPLLYNGKAIGYVMFISSLIHAAFVAAYPPWLPAASNKIYWYNVSSVIRLCVKFDCCRLIKNHSVDCFRIAYMYNDDRPRSYRKRNRKIICVCCSGFTGPSFSPLATCLRLNSVLMY